MKTFSGWLDFLSLAVLAQGSILPMPPALQLALINRALTAWFALATKEEVGRGRRWIFCCVTNSHEAQGNPDAT